MSEAMMLGDVLRVRTNKLYLCVLDTAMIHKSLMQSSGDPLRILLHASRYIYSQREFYLSNALCAHCEKPIENRNNEEWLHEDGFSGCDLEDVDVEATPAIVKDSEIRRAA